MNISGFSMSRDFVPFSSLLICLLCLLCPWVAFSCIACHPHFCSSLQLLYDKLYKFLITGMHSSRMRKLVIVTVRTANTDLQNAPSPVKPMTQCPVKEACLMLWLTLDGWVYYADFIIYSLLKYLFVDLFPLMSHGKTYDVLSTVLVMWEERKSGVKVSLKNGCWRVK